MRWWRRSTNTSAHIKETLFHGTIYEIDHVDVSLGRGNKDFGQGFYMAVSQKQAIDMMHKKYREAVKRSRGKQDIADRLIMDIKEISWG